MALLIVNQPAERLGTSVRFVRRLVHERRIAYTKLGQHVRIEESDIDAFVAAGRVEPHIVNARLEQLAWLSTSWSTHSDTALVDSEGETGTRPGLTPQGTSRWQDDPDGDAAPSSRPATAPGTSSSTSPMKTAAK